MIDLISSEPFGSNPSAAQKVAFYEEDQSDPAGKQYGGTVVGAVAELVELEVA
jgi:hypothetical protein